MTGRPSGRNYNEMRNIHFEPDVAVHAEGSCMAYFGNTQVLCTASVENRVPAWLRDTGAGWITAEYGMLPRSTHTRTNREATRGKQSGRTQEIQRLIGRSLRAVTNLKALGEMQVRIDCDVIQADGGTRTASITGAYVALHRAFEHCQTKGVLTSIPLISEVAAISCGLHNGAAVIDLDYDEDSNADADANFVVTGGGQIVEVQATAETTPFAENSFLELMHLAKKGCAELVTLQRDALGLNE